MKHLLILLASFVFSCLFFENHIGLNLSIFSILTISLLLIYHPKQFKKQNVVLYTITYSMTALFVFIQHSNLSILANCFAFFTLVGVISESKSSIYVTWLNGIYTSISGFFHRNFEVDNTKEKVNWKQNIDIIHITKLIGIPLAFIIVFVLLYKNGNPLFNDLVSKINFNFINMRWILFTVLGYYLLHNISNPIAVEPATTRDLKTQNTLFKSETFSEEQLKKEKQLGTTLLGLLNMLLVLFIITDILSLSSMNTTKASELSQLVHSGINTLIASILIAIAIILYFFRGNLNFYTENKTLKNLSYAWIFLNVILIILIAIKNQSYITSFGLTYKRIGVHIYIFLTLIGLITTFLKVLQIKNLAFLFRRNTQIAFFILILLSSINWDYTITKYNLNVAKAFDINYLINLSSNNAIQLYDKKDELNLSIAKQRKITTKYKTYMQELNQRKWQEWTYENFSIDTKTLIPD